MSREIKKKANTKFSLKKSDSKLSISYFPGLVHFVLIHDSINLTLILPLRFCWSHPVLFPAAVSEGAAGPELQSAVSPDPRPALPRLLHPHPGGAEELHRQGQVSVCLSAGGEKREMEIRE